LSCLWLKILTPTSNWRLIQHDFAVSSLWKLIIGPAVQDNCHRISLLCPRIELVTPLTTNLKPFSIEIYWFVLSNFRAYCDTTLSVDNQESTQDHMNDVISEEGIFISVPLCTLYRQIWLYFKPTSTTMYQYYSNSNLISPHSFILSLS
jgi:hypothetical protein